MGLELRQVLMSRSYFGGFVRPGRFDSQAQIVPGLILCEAIYRYQEPLGKYYFDYVLVLQMDPRIVEWIYIKLSVVTLRWIYIEVICSSVC